MFEILTRQVTLVGRRQRCVHCIRIQSRITRTENSHIVSSHGVLRRSARWSLIDGTILRIDEKLKSKHIGTFTYDIISK